MSLPALIDSLLWYSVVIATAGSLLLHFVFPQRRYYLFTLTAAMLLIGALLAANYLYPLLIVTLLIAYRILRSPIEQKI